MNSDSPETASGLNGIELSLEELDLVVGGRMIAVRPGEEPRSGGAVVVDSGP